MRGMGRVKAGDIVEVRVRDYWFIARYEERVVDEFGPRVHRITPLHPDGTSNPGPSPNITFYRVATREIMGKLRPEQVATWEIPGGRDARRAYMPRGPRRAA